MIRHYLKLIWKRRGKNAFLTAELILAFLVIFGVMAFALKQFDKLRVPEGFRTENVYNIVPSINGDLDSVTLKNMREQFKREILALEDVRNATYSSEVTPYGGSTWSTNGGNSKFKFQTDYILCDEDYADVWSVKFNEGRFFTEADFSGKFVPVVVNQLFADEFLKDTTALGFTFHMNGMDVVILGIVDHFKYRGMFSEEVPVMMVPIENHWGNLGLLTVVTSPNAEASIVKKMYDITAKVTKNFDFRIDQVEAIREQSSKSTWFPIIGLFALAGFLLINIAMGLFGILRYNISRRKPEIGLRKAMGANAGHIRSQFTGEMMMLTTLALIVGLVFAIQAIFLDVLNMESHIYWSALLIALCIIYGIVFICSLVPSTQAAAIEPAVTLHEE